MKYIWYSQKKSKFSFYFIQYTGIFQFTRQVVKMQKPKIFENTNNLAFTKTRNGTERDGTEKKTEQAEHYGTDYYGIRNKDGTNRMRKDGTGGTKRNRILRNTEHRRNIRIANGRNDTEHNYTIYGTRNAFTERNYYST